VRFIEIARRAVSSKFIQPPNGHGWSLIQEATTIPLHSGVDMPAKSRLFKRLGDIPDFEGRGQMSEILDFLPNSRTLLDRIG
jgi:hypothetical protein